jgi:alcohol dehydrogenase, propanol-preferring
VRAVNLTAFGEPYTVREDAPVPEPGPGEVRLRVLAVGVCGTDVKLWKGILPNTPLPLVPGHEIAAVVDAHGPEVAVPPLGTRVVVLHHLYCGDCARCREGSQNLCLRLRGRVGFDHDGGMADYVVVPARNLAPIPDGVSAAEACVVPDAVATTWRAVVRLAQVQPGDTVAVIGVGGLGLAACQIARLHGAEVLAVDVSRDKLDVAGAVGVSHLAMPTEAAARLRHLAEGGAPIVIDCAGTADALALAGELLPSGGRLIQVGYTPGAPLALQSSDVALKELRILGCRASTMQDLVDALDAVGSGAVRSPVEKLLPLNAVTDAVDAIAHGATLGRQVLVVAGEAEARAA